MVENTGQPNLANDLNMDTLVLDPALSNRLLRERQERGADRYDEVWEGTYIMAPAPNDEHQELIAHLLNALFEVVEKVGLGKLRPGVNIASDANDWERDYRIPDVVVFLNGSSAICHDTFWSGPPDFVIEVVSPFDKSREKLDFYGKVGTRELLLIDRNPWQLELFRLQGKTMRLVSKIAPGESDMLKSAVLPIEFRLLASNPRPAIEIADRSLQRSWRV